VSSTSAPPYSVRPANVDDAPALGRIRVDAWRLAYPSVVAREVLEGLDAEAETTRFAARLQTDPGVRTSVAVGADGVAAYCIYGADRDEPEPWRAEVYAIYVDPGRWRTGAGGLLLAACVAELVAVGRREVRLWTLTGNHEARAFYERQGWTYDGAERPLETLPAPDGSPVREVRYVLGAPEAG
jgi:GNAT superfamily N-acetyltransferase